jgi:hypothetical protein
MIAKNAHEGYYAKPWVAGLAIIFIYSLLLLLRPFRGL